MPSNQGKDLAPASAFLMYNKSKTITRKNGKKKRNRQGIQKKMIVTSESKKIMKQLKQNNTGHSGKNVIHDSECDQTMKPTLKSEITIEKNRSSQINKNTQLGKKTTDDPYLNSLQLLEWLIAPISAHEFFSNYWEQKVLHIKRTNESYYKHIFTSSSLDKILRNNHLYYTQNVDVVCYEGGEKKVYNQEGRAVPSAVWDYYSNGCSIRILNPQSYCHKVHLLLATLQEYFGSMVGANIYLTPPDSQGFAPHFDDIEAFVVQLEGRKHWKLYYPKVSDVLARYSSPNFKREEIGTPFMEITLNAGEILYFPRGTIHEGSTDADSHSLHITISVYQNTSYADLLQHILLDALNTAAEKDLEYRKGLPLNYLKKSGIGIKNKDDGVLKHKVSDLLKSLTKYVNIDQAVDKLGRKFIYDSMPPVLSKIEAERTSKADGPHLENGSVLNRVEICLRTKIRLLRYYCVRLVVESKTSAKLYYNTENATTYHGQEEQWLELDVSLIPCVQMLQSSYPLYIEVDQLPLKDVATKMQLVSDLWEHGILITEEPLEILED